MKVQSFCQAMEHSMMEHAAVGLDDEALDDEAAVGLDDGTSFRASGTVSHMEY